MASIIENAATSNNVTTSNNATIIKATMIKLDPVKVQQSAQTQAKYRARIKLKNEPETYILSVVLAGSNIIILKKIELVNAQDNIWLLYLPKHYSVCNSISFTKAITDLQQTVRIFF